MFVVGGLDSNFVPRISQHCMTRPVQIVVHVDERLVSSLSAAEAGGFSSSFRTSTGTTYCTCTAANTKKRQSKSAT